MNPTNTKLEADSGVSKAISTAGGPTFQDSCNDILAARSGQMFRGETAVTLLPAGTVCQLRCQCVVHAVMPHRTGKVSLVHYLECKAAGTVCQLKCQCVVHAVMPHRTGKLPLVHYLVCYLLELYVSLSAGVWCMLCCHGNNTFAFQLLMS